MLDISAQERYLELRRAILKKEYSYLNPRQREAVFASEGPLLLLAGAGSGKTTVLINRIAYTVLYGRAYESDEIPSFIGDAEIEELSDHLSGKRECTRLPKLLAVAPVKPWQIIAITFTNKAAGELKERLARTLGEDAAGTIWAATFHSACVRILRRHCERIGYKQGFTIYDDDDQKRVIKEVLKKLELDEKMYPPRSVAGIISRSKDVLMGPQGFTRAHKDDFRMSKVAEVYVEYQHQLKEANAMDFDDLIANTVKLFKECPDVLEEYQSKFSHVLIDEYQDTNHAQYVFASLLAASHRNICVVGDDDQSIYRFRGATIENILGFESEYEEARVIRLEQNYRSTQTILDAANAVIANNSERKGKTLWTEKGEGEKITDFTAEDEQAEGAYIADRILKNVRKGGNFRDHTILYRMNAQSNFLETAFQRNAIPYRIVGGTRFFERAEIKDMIAYLQVIVNPADTLRLTRIANVPVRGIGQKSLATAAEIAEESGEILLSVMKNASSHPEIGRTAASMERFAAMMESLSEDARTLPPDELYEEVMQRTGYYDSLYFKPSDENRARLENITELKSNIIDYMKRADEPTLTGFLEEVALYTDIDRYDAGADAVTMMTVHSSKGLEFPHVFIVGMEEGIFPSSRSMETLADTEEERRLAYVAITRARESLCLTHARRRMIFGQTSCNPLSRFVEEIPSELTEKVGSLRDHGGIKTDGIPGGAVTRGYSRPERTPQPTKKAVSAASSSATSSIGYKPLERLPKYEPGMKVSHTVFGEGMLISCREIANDVLLEVAFDSHGTKRLLARSVQQYLKIV